MKDFNFNVCKRIALLRGMLLFLITFNSFQPLLASPKNDHKTGLRVFLHMDRLTYDFNEIPILNICIKNSSTTNASLTVYDILHTTFQVIVYDMNGREAEIIVPYRLMNKNIEDVIRDIKPRVIELSPKEIISHSINLKDVYNLIPEMEYRVKGYLFSDLKRFDAIPSENILTFRILKSLGIKKEIRIKEIDRKISASEIILLALTAEKKRDWDNYFKYIKVESYINAFSDYVRVYNEADEKKRLNIIDNFIKFLKRDRVDHILNFKIIEESVFEDQNIAHVDVEVIRFGPIIPFTYKYKYVLERYDNFWLITDVEATVRRGKRS
ncbi:MAG: hypothetical protein SVZ03_08630 [Spirochaetota bacterium]|nr:hypothetical protein [Spirochaetota bacterium]